MARIATINVSLPASLKHFVLEEVEVGSFGSASEYIRMLIRDARTRASHPNTPERPNSALSEGGHAAKDRVRRPQAKKGRPIIRDRSAIIPARTGG
jgi:Arc/MetJ-type ribon-helix-helix transcriptional regulator